MNLAVRDSHELARKQAPREGRPISLRLDDVSLKLPGGEGQARQLLEGVNLIVKEKEFVSIVGPSGCGKSTLLNCVAGLRTLSRGRIERQAGADISSRSDIGYMFQSDALLPWRTVLQNVELSLELAGVAKRERHERCLEILAKLGLGGHENRYPNRLSGGMRQRVSLARVLAADPSLILMDEPFGALDAQTKLIVQELLLASWEENRRTVVFVTHDLSEAIALSDRIVVMGARPGRILREYNVNLPRPRHLAQIRSTSTYTELWDSLWNDLRSEALQTMEGQGA